MSGKWREDGVRVVRANAVKDARASNGRATVFDFAGSGGTATWIGSVSLPALAKTGLHHHGRHEVMVYIAKGRSEIRWGERLEFKADVGPGDFLYFTPFVPHQEFNPDPHEAVEFVVVRSDNEKIVVKLDGAIAEQAETVY